MKTGHHCVSQRAYAEGSMRSLVGLFPFSRIVLVLTVSVGVLTCESASRLAPPSSDRALWRWLVAGLPLIVPTTRRRFFSQAWIIALLRSINIPGQCGGTFSPATGLGAPLRDSTRWLRMNVVAVGDVDIYAFNRATGDLASCFRAQ